MTSPSDPIVIDSGSYVTKAGFAGNEVPSVLVPSVVGKFDHLEY
jgi:actin-related protein